MFAIPGTGYHNFQSTISKMRRDVKVAAVVGDSFKYLQYANPRDEEALKRALRRAALAKKEVLDDEEFQDALERLKHEVQPGQLVDTVA